jgi:hypothetical protein
MALMIVALFIFFVLDAALASLLGSRAPRGAAPAR